ncbi:hypothetical protein RclHR1_01270002 [Rhizophagus clarus]|uniref:Uncharacterized protein n=1 Tax=Rhizophagus clarus TaxID=94130 RepID=A0A2Z6R0T4_9GLOM|nr:hypothetical protein RclHR1_01270002 [Rhizophagus clarus]
MARLDYHKDLILPILLFSRNWSYTGNRFKDSQSTCKVSIRQDRSLLKFIERRKKLISIIMEFYPKFYRKIYIIS